MISTNLTSPRFSQLLFWPAGFLTSLLVIENITDIFLSIWTLWVRCATWKKLKFKSKLKATPVYLRGGTYVFEQAKVLGDTKQTHRRGQCSAADSCETRAAA